jgi:hypothetical protein
VSLPHRGKRENAAKANKKCQSVAPVRDANVSEGDWLPLRNWTLPLIEQRLSGLECASARKRHAIKAVRAACILIRRMPQLCS